MIVRIAIVLWWCGLLAVLFATSMGLLDAFQRSDCTSVLSLRFAIELEHMAAVEEYQRSHPSPAGHKPDSVQALLEAAANTPADARDTSGLRERAASCATPLNTLGLFFGWGCALILWTLAYIVGGRFCVPPRGRA